MFAKISTVAFFALYALTHFAQVDPVFAAVAAVVAAIAVATDS